MSRRANDPAELARGLDVEDLAALERARDAACARPISYVLGSGEADEVALHAGIKPLVRQVVPDDAAAPTRARFEALGLAVREALHRVDTATTRGRVLFVARDPRRAEAAAAIEAEPEHDVELGKLLGYPRCCVEAYLAAPPPRENLDVLARAAHGVGHARLNVLDLAVFHYVSWIPCSLTCSLSLAYADAVATHIAKRHGQLVGRAVTRCPPGCRHEVFVREIDRALSAHRIVLFEDVQLSVRGAVERDVVRVDALWPTARDRHPDAMLDDAALEAVARVMVALEGARTLAVHDGTLFADERALVSTPRAALYRFS
ncbi:DUF483 domain-containing protein [Sandaracinus amylolyticus]|uniref:Uncharacterized protein n=1 Tax=Sandaracinus amylolyticus TaxID=927083 RepID=A0A0F6VZ01_9BACT|nr:DUF483 domain-containing protein [Sandaracinus amylolyticus]AKF03223.1 hypothetical protein DB32_000372 [Sandaracinus amylolyticus]